MLLENAHFYLAVAVAIGNFPFRTQFRPDFNLIGFVLSFVALLCDVELLPFIDWMWRIDVSLWSVFLCLSPSDNLNGCEIAKCNFFRIVDGDW